MPYIAIKAYQKDEATKRKVADRINQIFLEEWGCPPQAISISIEEFTPQDFDEKVKNTEMQEKSDKMLILSGKKTY